MDNHNIHVFHYNSHLCISSINKKNSLAIKKNCVSDQYFYIYSVKKNYKHFLFHSNLFSYKRNYPFHPLVEKIKSELDW